MAMLGYEPETHVTSCHDTHDKVVTCQVEFGLYRRPPTAVNK